MSNEKNAPEEILEPEELVETESTEGEVERHHKPSRGDNAGLARFIEANKNNLMIAGGIILLGILYLAFFNGASPEAEDEAGNNIFHAVKYFEKDSLNLALNGDGSNPGFLELSGEYSGTKVGNLCNYYMGIIYLRQGNSSEAYNSFDAFDKGDNLLSAIAYSAMASIKEDQADLEGAASYYEKASGIKKNNQTTPFFLQHAARCYQQSDNKDAALRLYRQIRDDYPNSTEASQVDKYIARLEPIEE